MSATPPTIPLTNRLAGLDRLRTWGTLLVVLLHAGVPYLPEAMPGLAWPVDNHTASPAVAAVFWSIEAMIMPLFFTISGVSTWLLLQERGPDALLRNRYRRLFRPLVTCGFALLAIEFYIWNLGDVRRGYLTWRQYFRFSMKDYDSRLWGLGHLWYIEYLLLYTLILAVAWRYLPVRTGSAETTQRSRLSVNYLIVPALCCLPVVVILAYHPIIVIGFRHSFLPIPRRFLYFAAYFVAGLALLPLTRQRPRLARNTAWGLTATGLLALPLLVPQIRRWLRETNYMDQMEFLSGATVVPPETASDWWLAVCLSAAAIGLSLGLTTLAILSERPTSRWLTYCAGAAFWVYLVHHGLLGAVHLLLDNQELDAATKFALSAAIVTALSLLSYELLVRQTWLGRLLNGGRRRETHAEQPDTLPAEDPQRRAA